MISLEKTLEKIADKFSGKSGVSEMFVNETRYSSQTTINADDYPTVVIDIAKSGYRPIALTAIGTENNGGSGSSFILLRGYKIMDAEVRLYVRSVRTLSSSVRAYAEVIFVKT